MTLASTVQGSVSGHYEHVCLYFKRNCPVRGNVPRSAAHDHTRGHVAIVIRLLRKIHTFDRIFIFGAPTVTESRNLSAYIGMKMLNVVGG